MRDGDIIDRARAAVLRRNDPSSREAKRGRIRTKKFRAPTAFDKFSYPSYHYSRMIGLVRRRRDQCLIRRPSGDTRDPEVLIIIWEADEEDSSV